MHHRTIQTALVPKVNLDYDYSIVDDPWNNRYIIRYIQRQNARCPLYIYGLSVKHDRQSCKRCYFIFIPLWDFAYNNVNIRLYATREYYTQSGYYQWALYR